MSCSTTSLTASTTTNTLTTEDPYVFTETVPTTPPTLFNTSQKSRNRFISKQQQQQFQTTTSVLGTPYTLNKESSFKQIKNYGTKTQASSTVSFKGVATTSAAAGTIVTAAGVATATGIAPTTAVLGVLNTNNIKYGPQSPRNQNKSNATKQIPLHVHTLRNENAAAKAAVSTMVSTAGPPSNGFLYRSSAASQKSQIQQKQLSSNPPPLFISHTPSLWHTQLILDSPLQAASATSNLASTSCVEVSSSVVNHTTSAVTIPSKPASSMTFALQPPTPTLTATALISPMTMTAASNSTTAPGNIAPLHLIMPSAAPLPPSNFHNTTLAQHLQKVQCLKKPKKPNPVEVNGNVSLQKESPNSALKSKTASTISPPNPTKKKNTTKQHSTTDLNEIPVNVIFRSPQKTNLGSRIQKDNSVSQNLKTGEGGNQISQQIYDGKNLTDKSPTINLTLQKSSNTTHSTSIAASEVQIKHPQKLDQNMQQNRKSVNGQKCVIRSNLSLDQQQKTSITESATIEITTATRLPPKVGGKRKTNTLGQKTQKRQRKTNSYPIILGGLNPAALGPTQNLATATKAFGVISIPISQIENDTSQLAEDSELPYCIQKHWFSPAEGNWDTKFLQREERIVEYKSLLRRQAIQYLATRSLQKVPVHIARKRLLCVDALLRKYRDHSKIVGGYNTRKQCEAEDCKNLAMEMTSLCPQHITKNKKQCIFVPCTAKVDNGQRACEIPVLNIQKQHTPPLCYVHATYQYGKQENSETTGGAILLQSPRIDSLQNNRKANAVIKSMTVSSRKKHNPINACSKVTTDPNLTKANVLNVPKNAVTLQRKNSTTSLESIGSNSHSSFGSNATNAMADGPTAIVTYNVVPQNNNNNNIFSTSSQMLSPPALAPLSYHHHNNNNNHNKTDAGYSSIQRKSEIFSNSMNIDPTVEQEINKLVAQFAMAAAATATSPNTNSASANAIPVAGIGVAAGGLYNSSFNFMNTNSNSNLTSSGIGSSSSLPSTDELLTQDVLSICENSSAYASSSEDTGLGELSESELMAASGGGVVVVGGGGNGSGSLCTGNQNVVAGNGGGGGCGGDGCGSGFNDDDVSPDEIPLGDTRLLEENDLANVFDSLPVNLNEIFNSVVRQDERDEVERALEIADKHLKTLQQTIGSDSDFLADFCLNEDILADTEDICSKMEIVSSSLSSNDGLLPATLYLDNATDMAGVNNNHATANLALSNVSNGNGPNCSGVMDIRGLLQT